MNQYIKFVLAYILCIYYYLKTITGFVILFFTKNHSNNFWHVKRRLGGPKCINLNENSRYGETKFVEVNNIRLHYVEKGDPSKKLIVFLHGFPEFWYSWRHQIEEFSKDYWCIAVDLRGYGDSDKPGKISDYTLEKLTDDVRELVKKLGRDKFILIGHDWGAVITWNYVKKYKETIERYVAMCAPSLEGWFHCVENSWEQFRMSWYMFFFQGPVVPELALSMYDLRIFESFLNKSGTITKQDVEAYKYIYSRSKAFKYPINYYRANMSFLSPRPFERVTDCPKGLYILGDLDTAISKDTIESMSKIYDNFTTKTINGKHILQQDKPQETNQLIRNFLEK